MAGENGTTLLGAEAFRTALEEFVELEGRGRVRVLAPDFPGIMRIQALIQGQATETPESKADRIVGVVSECWVDAQGARVFSTPEQLASLRASRDWITLSAVYDASMRVCGLSEREVDAALGESAGDPGSASSSDSPAS